MTGADSQKLDLIRSSLKLCPNFPKKGITFIDILGIFVDPEVHRALIDLILNRLKTSDTKIDAVIGLEARGFLFGPQIALELKIPFVPLRKQGKLPGEVVKTEYDLEYGKDTIEMQSNVLKPGTKVLLVDDILATGGTLGAAQKLCAELGCEIAETLVIIELVELNGRARLTDTNHFTALFKFSDADFKELGANPSRVHQSKDA